jgi:hypothetical protein
VELSIFRIPLDAAGATRIDQQVGYIHLWRYERSDGTIDLDGEMNLFVSSTTAQDGVPLSYDSSVQFQPRADFIRLEWAAQPGRTAVILISPNARAIEANNRPARQLVFQGQATRFTATTVTVGTGFISLLAANSTRFRAVLQAPVSNTSAIRIGESNASITAGAGILIEPGSSFIVTTSANVRAVSDVAGQSCRIWEETA